ncbi:MAG: AsnC family transcriptional regulator [Kiloniellales bacterium]|nr:AsnC family transcriptional regulator [Kiloniellales bacterium]
MSVALDSLDRRIVNGLQGGFPVCERPYAEAAAALGIEEEELIARLGRLVETGALSRFAPLFNAERLGGAVCLCGMAVPAARFDTVAEQVNAHPEVAHNYARDHALNMWFVLASEHPERIEEVAKAIEAETGLSVYSMPKLDEFFIGLKVEV